MNNTQQKFIINDVNKKSIIVNSPNKSNTNMQLSYWK